MIIQPAAKLRKLGTDIFAAQGLIREKAEFLAETLVEASLTGHDSHGVTYFASYSNRMKTGFIDVNAEPTVVKETASSALVDGNWAPGQITDDAVSLTTVASQSTSTAPVSSTRPSPSAST